MSLKGGKISPPSQNRLLGFLVESQNLSTNKVLIFNSTVKKWFTSFLSYSQLKWFRTGDNLQESFIVNINADLEEFGEFKIICSGTINGGKITEQMNIRINTSTTSIFTFIRQVLIKTVSATSALETQDTGDAISFDYGSIFNQTNKEELQFYLELDVNPVFGDPTTNYAGTIALSIYNASTKKMYSTTFNFFDASPATVLQNFQLSLSDAQTFGENTTVAVYGLLITR